MATRKTTIVKGKHNGLRLDLFLLQAENLWGELPPGRGEIQGMIRSGEILVAGKERQPGYRVKPGEEVTVSFTPKAAPLASPLPTIPLLFEGTNLLVINKPAGLTMHPARKGQTGTLTDWIRENYPQIAKVGEDATRP